MIKNRPAIFDESNRAFWDVIRRPLLWLLRELDRWYDWKSSEKFEE